MSKKFLQNDGKDGFLCSLSNNSSTSLHTYRTRSSKGVCCVSPSSYSPSIVTIPKSFLEQTKQKQKENNKNKVDESVIESDVDYDYEEDEDDEVYDDGDEDYEIPSKKRKMVAGKNQSSKSNSKAKRRSPNKSSLTGSKDAVKEKKVKIIGKCIGQCDDDDPYSHDYLRCKKCNVSPFNCNISNCPCNGVGKLIPTENNKRLFSHQIPDHKRSIRVFSNRNKQAIERVERSIEYHNSSLKSPKILENLPKLPMPSSPPSTLTLQKSNANKNHLFNEDVEDIENQLPLNSIPIIGGMLMLQMNNDKPSTNHQKNNQSESNDYLDSLSNCRKRSFSEFDDGDNDIDDGFQDSKRDTQSSKSQNIAKDIDNDDAISLAEITDCSTDSFVDWINESFENKNITNCSDYNNCSSNMLIEASQDDSNDMQLDNMLEEFI